MYGSREQVNLVRQVEAIQIPDGNRVSLPEGTRAVITQELGASFTVMTEYGAMYRIDERDADALGKEAAASELPTEAPTDPAELEELVWNQLRKCYDPEIPANVVDLGLVYDCQIGAAPSGAGKRVEIKMTLTAPGCGMGPVLAEDVRVRVDEIPGVEATQVEIVFDPPWNPGMMTEAARLQLGFM